MSSWPVKGYFFVWALFLSLDRIFSFLFKILWYNGLKGGDDMKKLMIGSTVMLVLVLARCIATVFMERYYGRTEWIPVILDDPWFYVGIAAMILIYITAIITLIQGRKKKAI